MSLTRSQEVIEKNVHDAFVAMLTKWSENPSNFDNIIEALRGFRTFFSNMLKELLGSYIELVQDPLDNSHFPRVELVANPQDDHRFFSASNDLKNIMTMVKTAMNNISNSESLKEICKRESTKETRITHLSVMINDQHYRSYDEIRKNKELVSRTNFKCWREYTEISKIKFADNTEITIHSLDNIDEVENARITFESKMQELASRPKLSM